MKRTGTWFIIIGAGAFILPLMGLQFRIISIFGRYQSIVAIAFVVIGIVLKIADRSGRSSQDTEYASYGSGNTAYTGQGAANMVYGNQGTENTWNAGQGTEGDMYANQESESADYTDQSTYTAETQYSDYTQGMDEAAASTDNGQGSGFDSTNDQQ